MRICWLLACLLPCISQGRPRICFTHASKECSAFDGCSKYGDSECNISVEPPVCMCRSGCAGSNGHCSDEAVEQVGGEQVYKIRSARWEDYYMSVDAQGRISYTNESHEAVEFYVLKPPDGGEVAHYMLALKGTEDLIFWRPHVHKGTGKVHSWYLESRPISADDELHYSLLQLVGIGRRSPEANKFPVLLGSLELNSEYHWLFLPIQISEQVLVHNFIEFVDSQRGNPGAAGWWYFEPDLPESVYQSLSSFPGMCRIADDRACNPTTAAPVPDTIVVGLVVLACFLVFRIASWITGRYKLTKSA